MRRCRDKDNTRQIHVKIKLMFLPSDDRLVDNGFRYVFAYFVQWSLDLTRSLGIGQICSLNGGFVISKTSV